MNKIYRVFISSTYEDLQEERKEITQALLEMDCFPIGMEMFQASNESQWALIQKVISESDYYIVVVAGRYGSVHEKTHKSYTQMEYEFALKMGIPILGFIYKDISSLPSNKIDNKKQVEKFIRIVQQKEVRYWSNPHELAGLVSRAMHKIMDECPRLGWVRNVNKPSNILDLLQKIMKANQYIDIGNLQSSINNGIDSTPIKQSNPSKYPEIKPNFKEHEIEKSQTIEYKNLLYLDELKLSVLAETTNIMSLAGATALAIQFDKAIYAQPPLCTFQNWIDVKNILTKKDRINICHSFWRKHIFGYIVLNIEENLFRNFYIQHVRDCSLRIPPQDINSYKKSICSEIGSIFSGNSVTSLSNLIDRRIDIEPICIQAIEKDLKDSDPIFFGKQLLKFYNGTEFNSYILLDLESTKVILNFQEQYFYK